MKANLPTREEINVHDSLDGRPACKNFLGKSLEEAEGLFREKSLHYQEDLMWMGPVAFRFYVQAAIKYLQSPESKNDSDIIHCLIALLEFRLEHERDELLPIANELVEICRYIISHYDRFDMTPEIYGDLRPRYEKFTQNIAARA